MIKRTIEISMEPVHLAVKLDQLQLQRHEANPGTAASIPCEDIGLVIVDHPQVTYSHQALAKLIEFGAAVLFCGRDHLPAGMLLPLATHTEVVWRIQDQIAASKPLCKRLWQQIIVAKIHAQAANLAPDNPARGKLLTLADEVKSGDPTNVEAQAAKVYWSAWLGDPPGTGILPVGQGLEGHATCGTGILPVEDDLEGHATSGTRVPAGTDKPFRRDPDGDGLNALLNYGYAVLRAAVGRALVGSGLHPALGIHHANRSNPFCLADDLLEPLRPLVDARVRDLNEWGLKALEKRSKVHLLELLTATVRMEDQTGPLMIALHRMTASLAKCLAGGEKKLSIPVAMDRD